MSKPTSEAKTVWGYAESDKAERWSGMCATREEAIKEGRSEYRHENPLFFYVIEGTQRPASAYVPDADWVVEQMAETADGGEASEEFPEVSDEAKEKLNKLLEAWADENVKVNFWVSDGVAERIGPDDEPTA